MMSTATNGSYDGCYHTTVQGHVVALGMEGKEECTAFHRELLAGNIKPAASGDRVVASQCGSAAAVGR
jgi:hypothetical protein